MEEVDEDYYLSYMDHEDEKYSPKIDIVSIFNKMTQDNDYSIKRQQEREELYKEALVNGTLEINEANLIFYTKYLNKNLNFPFKAEYTDGGCMFDEMDYQMEVFAVKVNLKSGLVLKSNYGAKTVNVPIDIATLNTGI